MKNSMNNCVSYASYQNMQHQSNASERLTSDRLYVRKKSLWFGLLGVVVLGFGVLDVIKLSHVPNAVMNQYPILSQSCAIPAVFLLGGVFCLALAVVEW